MCASILCELIYVIIILAIGIPLYGNIQMSMPDFAMNCLNTILIIISFCTIFNFISLICSEITVATTISMLLFIAMFIAQGAFAITATASPYIIHFDTEGNEIITQELDPRYPGDAKVKMAKTIYFLIPEGQAMRIGSTETEYLYEMPIYSIIFISILNIGGIYIFYKKELK